MGGLTTACSGRANHVAFYHQRPQRAADAGRSTAFVIPKLKLEET
jgi:hypothetical protein